MGLLGLQRSEQFSMWSHLSTHSFTKCHTHSIFLHFVCIHVQCFCLSCGEYISLPAYLLRLPSPPVKVKNYHEHRENDSNPHQLGDTFSSPSNFWMPPPVNMNVTCISCIYTIEIQHISPLYTSFPHVNTKWSSKSGECFNLYLCSLWVSLEDSVKKKRNPSSVCSKMNHLHRKRFYTHYTMNKILNVHLTFWLFVILNPSLWFTQKWLKH